MKGFRTAGGAQRFLSAFSGISPHFRPRRHLMTAHDYRAEMTVRFAIWDHITGVGSRLNLAPRPHPNLPARYSHCTSNKLTRPYSTGSRSS